MSADALPDYGQSFALWRAGAAADWAAYTRHPFVEGMLDGTLPRAAYVDYLVQDYLFLIHFARAWALAVVKAETMAERRAAARTVQALLVDEMSLHESVCAAEGIAPSALVSADEGPGTLAYTRYVLEAGYSGDFLDLMAALAPCVLGYGEIGARLAATAGGTPYADWIASYGGAEYQALCRETGALIDAAVLARLGAAPQTSPRWPALCRHFAVATRLEAQFWTQGK